MYCYPKNFFITCMVSVDLVGWQETNMFLSLALPRQFLAERVGRTLSINTDSCKRQQKTCIWFVLIVNIIISIFIHFMLHIYYIHEQIKLILLILSFGQKDSIYASVLYMENIKYYFAVTSIVLMRGFQNSKKATMFRLWKFFLCYIGVNSSVLRNPSYNIGEVVGSWCWSGEKKRSWFRKGWVLINLFSN